MTFDFTEFASSIANTDSKNLDRDFIPEGTHIMEIEEVECKLSQKTSNKIVILEWRLLSSDTLTPSQGDSEYYKTIFSLSGVPEWKVNENKKSMKQLVLATLEDGLQERDITAEMVGRCFSEGMIRGAKVKIICVEKTSKNGKQFFVNDFLKANTSTDWAQPSSDWTAPADSTPSDEEIPF